MLFKLKKLFVDLLNVNLKKKNSKLICNFKKIISKIIIKNTKLK